MVEMAAIMADHVAMNLRKVLTGLSSAEMNIAVGPSAPPIIPSFFRSLPVRFLTPVARPITLKKQSISEAVFL